MIANKVRDGLVSQRTKRIRKGCKRGHMSASSSLSTAKHHLSMQHFSELTSMKDSLLKSKSWSSSTPRY